MIITVNGKEVTIEKELTVQVLLDSEYVEMQEYVTVQLNEDIISKKDYESQIVKAGDVVEFLYYMGGGSY